MHNKDRIDSLTSLRFFAAFAIVLHHARGIIFPWDFLSGVRLDAGVSFFFVLSGFILSYVYSESMRTMRATVTLKFFISRAARIWPAHACAFLFVIVLIPSSNWTYGAGHPWVIALMNASLLQSLIPIPAYYFSFNAVSWSISTEAIFYLVFPLLVASLNKTWHWKLMVLIVIGFVASYATDHLLPNYYSPQHLTAVSGHGIAYINPIARIQEFYVGILFFMFFKRVRTRAIFTKTSCTVLEIVAIICVFLWVPEIQNIFYSPKLFGGPAQSEYSSHISVSLVFGYIVFCFALNRGAFSRLLSLRPFVLLGDLSFSIYLLHQIFFGFYGQHRQFFGDISSVVIFCFLVSFTFAVSYCVWRWIETPANSLIKMFFSHVIPNATCQSRKAISNQWSDVNEG